MAHFSKRYPLNVTGKYYIDDQCTDCDLCRETAPDNVKRDDRTGISYVYKQPENQDEITLLEEGVEGCPTEAVGNDGDKFDWKTTPIFDWNGFYQAQFPKENVRFDISAPLISERKRRFWWWPF